MRAAPYPTLNVDLYSGPGVGKSVLMSRLYTALKLAGIHAEMVPEYAKELTYTGELKNTTQSEIATEQLRRQSILQGHVQVAITDSGVPLSLAYCTEQEKRELSGFIRDGMAGWNSVNVLLHRDVLDSYEPGGRNQTPEEAHHIHHQVMTPFFRSYFAEDLLELSTIDAYEVLLDLIQRQIKPANACRSVQCAF